MQSEQQHTVARDFLRQYKEGLSRNGLALSTEDEKISDAGFDEPLVPGSEKWEERRRKIA